MVKKEINILDDLEREFYNQRQEQQRSVMTGSWHPGLVKESRSLNSERLSGINSRANSEVNNMINLAISRIYTSCIYYSVLILAHMYVLYLHIRTHMNVHILTVFTAHVFEHVQPYAQIVLGNKSIRHLFHTHHRTQRQAF